MGVIDKIVGGASQVAAPISSAINAVSTSIQNRKNREWTEKQNDLAWQRQNQLINEQRAYDTPKAQMQRLMEAGLNPNLIYGDLGGNMQAASAPNAAGSYSGVAPQIDPLAISQSLLNLANVNKVNKETQLTDKKIEEILGKTPMAQANIAYLNAETNRLVQENKLHYMDEQKQEVMREFLETVTENGEGEVGWHNYVRWRDKIYRLYFKDLDVKESDMDLVLSTYFERAGIIKNSYKHGVLENQDLQAFVDIASDYYKSLSDEQSAVASLAQDDNKFVKKFGGREAFRAISGLTGDVFNLIGSVTGKRLLMGSAKRLGTKRQ